MIREINDLENYIPKNKYSKFVKQYFLWMYKEWTKKYISNIDVEIKFLEVDNYLIPLSFGNYKDNCYTTSILWSIKYAKEELKKEKDFLKRNIFIFFLSIFYYFFRIFKIEDNIFVFNYFLSTILYPKLNENIITKITTYLKQYYPDKAIIFRSINNNLLGDLKKILKNLNFKEIASRQIFYFDKWDNIFKNKSVKEDFRASKKVKLDIKNKDFTDFDIDWIKKCYDELYIKKYSKNNPLFTKKFYKNLLGVDNFYINLLLKEGKIYWVYWYYIIENQATTPIYWYILKYNKSKKLYRQLTFYTLQSTLEKIQFLNHSSWAWKFKINRWAKMDIEYLMVYYEHLNFYKKVAWKFLHFISKKIIKPNLKNNIY